jgi:hypothetical protein
MPENNKFPDLDVNSTEKKEFPVFKSAVLLFLGVSLALALNNDNLKIKSLNFAKSIPSTSGSAVDYATSEFTTFDFKNLSNTIKETIKRSPSNEDRQILLDRFNFENYRIEEIKIPNARHFNPSTKVSDSVVVVMTVVENSAKGKSSTQIFYNPFRLTIAILVPKATSVPEFRKDYFDAGGDPFDAFLINHELILESAKTKSRSAVYLGSQTKLLNPSYSTNTIVRDLGL